MVCHSCQHLSAPLIYVHLRRNIERGFQLAHIIRRLKALDADVILLQECDMGCARTDRLDITAEIAAATDMRWSYFASEYSVKHGGVHGNAILSRLPLVDTWVCPLPCARSGSDDKCVCKYGREPHHCCVAARVITPNGPLCVYSVHLDALWCGAKGRRRQLAALMADANSHRLPTDKGCVLGGDMNTVSFATTHTHTHLRFILIADGPRVSTFCAHVLSRQHAIHIRRHV